MLLLVAVLVAIVSNLDNLTAGFALGIRGTRIAITPNLIIAAITMAGTATAITSGHALARLLAPTVASAIGAVIIIAIGTWTLAGSLSIGLRGDRLPLPSSHAPAEKTSPVSIPATKHDLTRANAVALGIALAMNNIGTGVGAGVAGLTPLATTFLAGAISLLFVKGGANIGALLGEGVIARPAQQVSGLILLALGTAMLTGLG